MSTEHELGLEDFPGVDLDDLLEQVKARAAADSAAHARLTALLGAVIAVGSDLHLPAVLQRIVDAACTLVDARYGALGVLSPEGDRLAEFVTSGVTAEERAAIGSPPHGLGVLGLLIREPRPLRVADISAHPESYGLPPHHPKITSFLGTPIRVRDQVYGNLYLAEKQGAPAFDEQDEAVLVALARATGVAIDNARLFEAESRARAWSEASAEVARALLQGRDESAALQAVAQRVRELVDASVVLVATHGVGRRGGLAVRARVGGRLDAAGDLPVLEAAWWPATLAERRAVMPGPEDLARSLGLPDAAMTAVLPLGVGDADVGALVVGWAGAAPPPDDLAPLPAYARSVGVALVAASAQRERARAAVLEDRDRIARDMHDVVIQRLFATGLSLQSSTAGTELAAVRARTAAAVDELDAAISDIRHAIFALHRRGDPSDLHEEVSALVRSAAARCGVVADLDVVGDLARVPEEAAPDLLAVVREGLANVTRHAHATTARVSVEVGDELRVRVVDDGVGVPLEPDGPAHRSGLANLERRARVHGGALSVRRGVPAGTVLEWTAPLAL